MDTREPWGRNSPEVRARAVRLVPDHAGEYGLQWEAMVSISGKIGCSAKTLRSSVRRAERNEGLRPGPTCSEQARVRDLEREVRELPQLEINQLRFLTLCFRRGSHMSWCVSG